MADQRSDEELVEAARRDDAAALTTLYDRHKHSMLRIAARFGAHGHDALDVRQDAFLYLLQRLPTLRLRARFSTFLFHVVRSRAQQSLRRAAPARADRDRVDLDQFAADPRRDLDGLVDLPGLPEAQRHVLQLRFVEGLELAAIAAELSLPLGTVKSRLHQAFVKLRDNPRMLRPRSPDLADDRGPPRRWVDTTPGTDTARRLRPRGAGS